MIKQLNRYLEKHTELTVCEELCKQGYITAAELDADIRYNKATVKPVFCLCYRVTIMPVVLLMRVLPIFSRVVYPIAWLVWLKRSCQEHKDG